MWRLIADMSPEQIVDLIDFRYISDALTPAEALAILRRPRAGKAERIATLWLARLSGVYDLAGLARLL